MNRSPRKIHSTFLRAIDVTLAAHASLFEGRSAVSPELIEALLRTEGYPQWFEGPTKFQYGPAQLARIHKATGAGVLIWAEIFDGGRIALHATASMSGADPAPWQDVTLDGGEDFDRILYDAPRALLTRLQDLGRIRRVPNQDPVAAPSDEHLRGLDDARSLLHAGDPASFVRAESVLARLIVERPHWSEPWIELAFLRVARPLLFEPTGFHGLMNEGPIAARHIAFTLPTLSETGRARLAFIDHLFIGHRESAAEFAAVVDALPRPSLERALMAMFHSTRDPERFGVEPMPRFGALGRILFELSTRPGPRARAARAAELIEAGDALASGSVLALRQAEQHYSSEKHWGRVRSISARASTHAAAQAIEVLWDGCRRDRATETAACRDSLYQLVNEYVAPSAGEATDLGDERAWREAAARFASRVGSGEVPEPPRYPIPNLLRDAGDEGITGLWYATNRLMATANAVLDESRALEVGGDERVSSIVGRPRSRLVRSLDWLLTAAYRSAALAKHEKRRDDYERFAAILHPLATQYEFDMAFASRYEVDGDLGREIPHLLALNSLASRHPYHPDYFRDYVRATGPDIWRSLSPWIAALVPLPPVAENLVWMLRFDAGERDATISALERALSRRQNSAFALTLDSALRFGPRPDLTGAHAVLEAALVEFPFDERLFEQSAWVALEAERFDLAERRFATLRDGGNGFRQGCLGLAQLARRQRSLSRAENVLAECGEKAKKAWDRHDLLLRAATMQRDDGRYAESIRTIERAAAAIGSSRAVLEGRAASWALSGDLARAAAALEQSRSLYRAGGGWESALALADLELARGDGDRAKALFDAIRDAGDGKRPEVMELARRIALAQGELDGFESLCRDMAADGLYPLARFQWEIQGDSVAALASLSEARAERPNDASVAILFGEILVAHGDPEAALAEARRASEIEKSDEAVRLEIVSQLEKGALDEVADWVAIRLASDRWSISTWEHKARLEIAKGESSAARATLAWATSALRQPGIGGEFAWWRDLRPLLLLETSLVGKTPDPVGDARLEALLSETVKRLPNDVLLWQALIRVREHLGRAEDASAAQQQLARVWPKRAASSSLAKLPASLDVESSAP